MAQKEDRRLNTIIGGKWRVDGLLGTGSMAAVYGVTHRNGVKAALKILHPALCTDAAVCERFLGEGYLTNSVKHSGIVRVLDDGMTDDGCVYLVMDLLEGTTLELLRQERGGRIDVPEALDIADALMDALIAVHKANIIHRDLKPQNVFICENSDVKLLDFGVARVLETSKAKNKMSLFGMVLGTPSFMSPEQAIGARDEVDHRADIWSLGATVFTALTGETVHLGPHVQAKLLAAGTVQARSISLVKQDLPAPIAAVIDTSLRFDKKDRWQSVEAFRRALREARKTAGLSDVAPVSIRDTDPRSHGPRSVRAGAAALSSAGIRSVAPASVPPAKRSTKRPPPPKPADKGPTRTYAGIGPLPGESFPPPKEGVPEAKRTLGYLPEEASLSTDPEGHTGAAAALPVGIIRAPIPLDAEAKDANDDADASDASYPAVGVLDDTNALMSQLAPKRAGVGLWVVSLAFLAAAIGGIAFFAMGGSHGDASTDDANAAAAPPTLTSAAPDPTPPPAPTGIVIGDPLDTKDGGAPKPHAATPPPPQPQRGSTPIAPPPTWHRPTSRNLPSNPNPSNPSRSSVSPEPPPANQPAPAAPAPANTDPFSTPE